VFTIDERCGNDKEWLRMITTEVGNLKQLVSVPEDCKKMIEILNDDLSIFCFKIGNSLCNGIETWCATVNINQTLLPNRSLPSDGVIPLLLLGELKENISLSLITINGVYYS